MSRRHVIVVGGGAAGLMAAGQAAAQGAGTLLLEKMDRPGVKLRITGQGRCNISNVAPIREALKRFVAGAHFVRPALYSFSPDDLRAFFGELGVPTEVQCGGRVFPVSEDALDIVHCTDTGSGCLRSSVCVTREVWTQIREATNHILRQTTLADLLQRQQSLKIESPG